MKFLKKFLCVVTGFLLLAFTNNYIINTASVVISPQSHLTIKGKTNISKFNCEFNINKVANPIELYYEEIDGKIIFEKAKLVLGNTCFDCGNNAINRDFRDLLKTNEYPEIYLQLKEIQKDINTSSSVKAQVQIDIAGKSKSYMVPVEINAENTICVSGILGLNIFDFDLVPPKKALGLIVVSEDIEIQFQLIFKVNKK
ncbi:YceI family protein [Flavobacteriaceae bacterium LMO-SS05]